MHQKLTEKMFTFLQKPFTTSTPVFFFFFNERGTIQDEINNTL